MSEGQTTNNQSKEENLDPNLEAEGCCGNCHCHEEEVEANSETLKEEGKSQPQEDFKSKFYYLAAEMDNMRKRYEREKESLIKFGNENILSSLLEVVDNFELSLNVIKKGKDLDDKVKSIVTGIEMVRDQLGSKLKSFGLEKVEAIGTHFDPNNHEALTQMIDTEKDEGTVIQVYREGYKLNGRLLRPSRVVVSKKS